MTIHKFHPKIYYNAFGSYAPVLRISDGDTVITSTVDNAGRDATDNQVTQLGNPLTAHSYSLRTFLSSSGFGLYGGHVKRCHEKVFVLVNPTQTNQEPKPRSQPPSKPQPSPPMEPELMP